MKNGLTARARRLYDALEDGMTREAWQRAARFRDVSLYPELGELLRNGLVVKQSTPAGNFWYKT
jgi:hypothetical protein